VPDIQIYWSYLELLKIQQFKFLFETKALYFVKWQIYSGTAQHNGIQLDI
jgi:hypothetical protein